MFLYSIVFVLLFCLVIRYDVMQHRACFKASWILVYFIIVCLSGFRYKLGADTIAYMSNYNFLPSLSGLMNFDFNSVRYDPLWIIFCSICKFINNDFFFMQFVHSLIVNALFFIYIYNNAKNKYTALLFYYLFGFLYFNTEIMRESLAVAVFITSLRFYYKRKWLNYFLFSILAFFIHSSAFIVLFFPLLSFINVNISKGSLIILGCLIISASLIWSFIGENIQLLFSLSASIEDKANAYLNRSDYIYNLNGIILGIVLLVIVPFAFVLLGFKMKFMIKEYPFVWAYTLFGIFVVFNSTVFTRFQNYLFFPFIIYLSYFMNSILLLRRRLILRGLLVLVLYNILTISYFYKFFKQDITGNSLFLDRYFPYTSVFDKEEIPSRRFFEQ